MKNNNYCPYCSAKMVEYKFSFNKGLAIFLKKLYEKNEPTATDDLNLTYSQRTNSQKLRYWGLAEQVTDTEEQRRKRGVWQITEKGKSFIRGEIKINKQVITYRNVVISYEGEMIDIHEAAKEKYYKHRQDYIDQNK